MYGIKFRLGKNCSTYSSMRFFNFRCLFWQQIFFRHLGRFRIFLFPSIFLILCNRVLGKKSQRAPFQIFGTMRLFKILVFRLVLGFLTYTRIFFNAPNFFKTGIFPVICDFSPICFYRNPLRFLPETKGFVTIEDSLGFLILRELPETLFEKI